MIEKSFVVALRKWRVDERKWQSRKWRVDERKWPSRKRRRNERKWQSRKWPGQPSLQLECNKLKASFRERTNDPVSANTSKQTWRWPRSRVEVPKVKFIRRLAYPTDNVTRSLQQAPTTSPSPDFSKTPVILLTYHRGYPCFQVVPTEIRHNGTVPLFTIET